jgi:hypothetical protein
MTTVFSQEYLGEKLTYTLGNRLSKQELQSCLASMEIVQPPVAKQFWQSAVLRWYLRHSCR